MNVLGAPAAWLPDGRYVYLVDRDLYISSPNSLNAQFVATLAVPSFSTTSSANETAVSPDGQRLAFTAVEERAGFVTDKYLWVVNIDGTGLRRLTVEPSSAGALDVKYFSPAWSPDGQWVAAILERTGGDPVDNFGPPGFNHTGCISQVLVFPASADNVTTAFPAYDTNYGVKVLSADGRTTQYLTSCNVAVYWLP